MTTPQRPVLSLLEKYSSLHEGITRTRQATNEVRLQTEAANCAMQRLREEHARCESQAKTNDQQRHASQEQTAATQGQLHALQQQQAALQEEHQTLQSQRDRFWQHVRQHRRDFLQASQSFRGRCRRLQLRAEVAGMQGSSAALVAYRRAHEAATTEHIPPTATERQLQESIAEATRRRDAAAATTTLHDDVTELHQRMQQQMQRKQERKRQLQRQLHRIRQDVSEIQQQIAAVQHQTNDAKNRVLDVKKAAAAERQRNKAQKKRNTIVNPYHASKTRKAKVAVQQSVAPDETLSSPPVPRRLPRPRVDKVRSSRRFGWDAHGVNDPIVDSDDEDGLLSFVGLGR